MTSPPDLRRSPSRCPNLIDLPAISRAEVPLIQGRVHELRKTRAGRAVLRANGNTRHGRKDVTLRSFVAWDGEGYNDAAGKHHYMLFGASDGTKVTSPSLGTMDCFQAMLSSERRNPLAIHVIFAGTYDVNMMLRDLPYNMLKRIVKGDAVTWNEIRVEFRRGKFFRIGHGVGKDRVVVTLWDVFSFFACSFVKAVRQYLGDLDELSRIEDGKGKRGAFTYADMSWVTDYWHSELVLLVDLCNSLRDNLTAAGIVLSQWHGPGAVASAVLKDHSMHEHMTHFADPLVKDAVQHSYFGGRFECFRIGNHVGTVYEYDINSAYPAAIAQLPNLRGATWNHVEGWTDHLDDHTLYHIQFRTTSAQTRALLNSPFPLPWRRGNGAVYFPIRATGWYWGPEVKVLAEHYAGTFVIKERLELVTADDSRPFSWVLDMYEQRAQWKRDGNPAQLALKLALNSMYGKTVQQVGYRDGKIPTWHQLEWGSWITSYTRAKLLSAAMQARHHVIAMETDALFTTVPLDLPVSENLGEWTKDTFDGITYLQSGVYWALADGQWSPKFRGFDPGSLTRDGALAYLSRLSDAISAGGDPSDVTPMATRVTRFKTLGTSLGRPHWRTWRTETRTITSGATGGKREHMPHLCHACMVDEPLTDTLHTMIPAPEAGRGMSKRYPLLWRDDDVQSDYAPSDDELDVELWMM